MTMWSYLCILALFQTAGLVASIFLEQGKRGLAFFNALLFLMCLVFLMILTG